MKTEWIRKPKSAKEKEYLFKQYQMIVDSSEQITQKRHKMNQFYMTINTFLVGIAGLLIPLSGRFGALVISFTGLLLSANWERSVIAYKKLNGAKFDLIHQLENYLPAQMYREEERSLDRRKYFSLTSLERLVPFIFGALYVGLLLIIGFAA